MLTLIESPDPPAHLLLGADANDHVRTDRQLFDRETVDWESVTRSTAFG